MSDADRPEKAGGYDYDIVVVGSGNGGMTAALAAAYSGMRALIVEKADYFGGTSALSGGAVWIPNNPVNVRAGVPDSFEDADRYLGELVGDRVPAERRQAYLTHGPATIEFLEKHTEHVRFAYSPGYSDYHPQIPGGLAAGRSISPVAVDVRKLGDLAPTLNRTDLLAPPAGIWLKPVEYKKLLLVTRTWRGRLTALRVGLRTAVARALGRNMVSAGAAGVVRLRLAVRDAGIPLWLGTPMRALIVDGRRVVGIRVERDGQLVTIRARHGVILAAGGFERNPGMRARYQRQPITATWTSGTVTNTGDAILAAQAIGADVDLMDRAWWGPAMLTPERALFMLSERSLPGSIMVDGEGRRFVNESAPYVDVVDTMYEQHAAGRPTIPCYLVFDQGFRDRYPFVKVPPRLPLPKAWAQDGTVGTAGTLAELAERIGVPAGQLTATVERFNAAARAGRDEEFGRGDSAYDRYYSDPTIRPNPNLAPLVKPPFYAARLVPGDLGTSGGLRCDEHARVLRADGSVIEGLYATGNCSAAVMGHQYPGPGATIGPAMVFGYIAARHIASLASPRPESVPG
ncbi:MAG: FAD-binding protein [Frankia sp.]|nr:FAD-binding protein [Frankia sp.]